MPETDDHTATTVHTFIDDALADYDAVGLAAAIRSGDICATEAVSAAIARAQQVNPALNAIAHPDFDRAHQRSQSLSPGVFSGVPTFIKDNTDVAGLPTNHGSLAVNAAPAKRDAPFAHQFLSTGAVSLGKSTMPEFGFSASTEYETLPPTRNPWSTSHSCGGSSGGAAALVAAGVVPFAHANDGGGSIRIPAAACGLVGLKMTRGREVAAANAAHLPVNIISNGIVSRSVRDTAVFAAAIGRDRRAALPPIGVVSGPPKQRLTIGVLGDPSSYRADAETAAATARTTARLADLGHHVTDMELPAPLSPATLGADFLHYWSMLAFAMHRFGKIVEGRHFDPSLTDALTRGLSNRFARNFWRTPAAIARLKRSEAAYRTMFDTVDVVLSPVVAITTPRLGYLALSNGFDVVVSRLVELATYTPLNNAAGGPAVSLPLESSAAGLPIGMHFSAAHGAERTLLELAFELESARPFPKITDKKSNPAGESALPK